MKVVIAPNAFKECLSPLQVAKAIEVGVKRALPFVQTVLVPLADGGDGTVEALVEATHGTIVQAVVSDPLGRPVRARYGILGDGKTAIIEMAEASGLKLLDLEERNPLRASTRGTGELILDAMDKGVRSIVIGIGGSGTVDGGMGMARALGYEFFDERGEPLAEGGGSLQTLSRIDVSGVLPNLSELKVIVACDVTNPLTGVQGAARVFGPQKGATPEMVERLELGLSRFGTIAEGQFGKDICSLPGAGAAGGLGGGLAAFTRATLESGGRLVARFAGLEKSLEGGDLVITGEGKLDQQTSMGKLPAIVAKSAAEKGIAVIALAGVLGSGWERLLDLGLTAAFCIQQDNVSRQISFSKAEQWLAATAEQACRAWLSGRQGATQLSEMTSA